MPDKFYSRKLAFAGLALVLIAGNRWLAFLDPAQAADLFKWILMGYLGAQGGVDIAKAVKGG